jgi:hypothetical protein
MAVRLHTNVGLVPDGERLESSPDVVLVREPTIGATTRSKGSLFAIATARGASARAREATRALLETVQREYYYDESAGIAICLEKAIRQANRRLVHRRDLHLPAGVGLSAAIAVIRERELYVATVGDADAFLARQGRLLTLPDAERGAALPTDGQLRVDVWRGEILVGDVLLLAAREMAERLGTDELRQAITTLHPTSAAEHLHHLLLAERGAQSDAVLVIEATEVPATRVEHQLVPVHPAEPLAGAPDRSPIPLADSVAGGVSAVRDTAQRAGGASASAIARIVDRGLDLLPRRRRGTLVVMSASERRRAERRVAGILLAALAVVLVAGTGAWLLGGHGQGQDIKRANTGESALQSARDQIDQVFGGGGDLVLANPQKALGLLRGAWVQLDAAEQAGVPAGRLQPLRDEVSGGLDRLYGAVYTSATTVVTMKKLDPAADLSGLVLGPDGAAYSIDRAAHTVVRFDLTKRTALVVARAGDGPGTGMGDPWMLTTGGPDLVIVDRNGGVWRWRPADRQGHGTLGIIRIGGSVTWGTDIRDVETYVHNADAGLYNLYVVDPSSRQILRYSPAADGSGFPADPTGYLATAADVSSYEQIFIDGDVYALTTASVTRFVNGRPDSFAPQTPPDDQDLRPGHHYQLMTASATRQQGTLYVYDSAHQRIVAFDKAFGDYQGEYIAATGTPAFADVRGMFLVEPGGGKPSSIVWVTKDRVLVTVLQAAPAPGASASPAPPSPSPRATPKTSAKPRRTVAPTSRP